MTEISIDIKNDKNIDNNSNIFSKESSFKETPIKNNDLIKNELKLDDNNMIIDNTNEIEQKQSLPSKCRIYAFVGRTLFLFFDKYSNPIFIIGPHWPMFIFVITTISSLMLFIYIKYWKYLNFYFKLFGSINFWLAFISYVYTSIINPGYPRNTLGRTFGIPKNDYYFCDHCKFYLKKSSYGTHCDFCDICIEDYDHHCAWTGHCIGKNNKISFFIMVPAIFILLVYFAFAFIQGISKNL